MMEEAEKMAAVVLEACGIRISPELQNIEIEIADSNDDAKND